MLHFPKVRSQIASTHFWCTHVSLPFRTLSMQHFNTHFCGSRRLSFSPSCFSWTTNYDNSMWAIFWIPKLTTYPSSFHYFCLFFTLFKPFDNLQILTEIESKNTTKIFFARKIMLQLCTFSLLAFSCISYINGPPQKKKGTEKENFTYLASGRFGKSVWT